MKKAILILLMVALLLVFTGCESSAEFTIKITGTTGVDFHGSYMAIASDGTSTSKSVDGTIPETYTVKANMVSLTFQKQQEAGTLKVEILANRQVM